MTLAHRHPWWTHTEFVHFYTPQGWMGVTSRDFDGGAYDDILRCIRRQGFFDCLGYDLVSADYDNGTYPVLYDADDTDRHWPHGRPRRARFILEAERQQREWDEYQRQKQLDHEAEADRQWNAEEVRRAKLAAVVA